MGVEAAQTKAPEYEPLDKSNYLLSTKQCLEIVLLAILASQAAQIFSWR